jgi:hypothetical protein
MDHPSNADVEQNLFRHISDDAIETDGYCSNVRIVGNRVEDALVGVSMAPAETGPTYVIRNLILDLNNVSPGSDWATRALKFNRPGYYSGEMFAYHNTAVAGEADQNAFTCTDTSDWQAFHSRNNLWVGNDYAFYYQNEGDDYFTHDYDHLHSTGDRLVRYQGTNYETIADYFAATGHCEHCQSGDPLFVDPDGDDYELGEGSPAVDQGVVIAGINYGYSGDAPDMGALEQGGETLTWPDGAGSDGIPDSGGVPGSTGGGDRSDASGDSDSGSGDDGSGCGCRLRRTTNAPASALLGFGLALGLVGRRRRRTG